MLCSRFQLHFPCQVLTWHTWTLCRTLSERWSCSIKTLVWDVLQHLYFSCNIDEWFIVNIILEYCIYTCHFLSNMWQVKLSHLCILLLLIGGSFWSLQVKPPRILGGQSKRIEKSYKFSQKSETFSHHSTTLIIIVIGSIIFF